MLLVFAAVTRVGWAIHVGSDTERITTNDTASYVEPAKALVDDQRFNEGPDSDAPAYLRTPGYPSYLAVSSLLVGDSARRLSGFQALFSVVTIGLVFVLARQLYDETVGMTAAALAAFEPLLFWASGALMTETLHGMLLMAVALTSVSALRQPWGRSAQWCAVGLAVASATMVRPVTYYFPILLLPSLLFIGLRRRIAARQLVTGIAMVTLPVVVVVGGWQVRNQLRVESWRLSGIEAVNMYEYRAAGITAETTNRPFVEVRDEFRADFGEPTPGEPVGPYYDRMYRAGTDIVLDDPTTLAIVSAKGFTSEAFGVATTIFPYLGIEETPVLLAISRATVVRGLGRRIDRHWPLLRSPGWRRAPVALSALLIGYVLAVSAGPEAYSRLLVLQSHRSCASSRGRCRAPRASRHVASQLIRALSTSLLTTGRVDLMMPAEAVVRKRRVLYQAANRLAEHPAATDRSITLASQAPIRSHAYNLKAQLGTDHSSHSIP